MIKSMTGFGKQTGEFFGKKYTVEARSVNSKQLDLNIKLPAVFREYEYSLRNEVTKTLERGKIDIYFNVEITDNTSNTVINTDLIKKYYSQLVGIANELGIESKSELLTSCLRIPDVIKFVQPETNDGEWKFVYDLFLRAVAELDEFRRREGNVLSEDFIARIANIENLLSQVGQFESVRIDSVKSRLTQMLNDNITGANIDQNRFEQELIYYLEKIDITEEKVRLSNHLKYFIETQNNELSPGKKLGFIAQEIGREINTMGSKANEVNIQRLVIQMKDELEKIKEQLLNIL